MHLNVYHGWCTFYKGPALSQLSDISFNIMLCEYNLSHFMGYNITSTPVAARIACGMNSGQGILLFTLISCLCWFPVQSCHKSRIENAALAKPDAGEIFPNKRCMKKNYYVTGTSREELVQNVYSAGLCGWLLIKSSARETKFYTFFYLDKIG